MVCRIQRHQFVFFHQLLDKPKDTETLDLHKIIFEHKNKKPKKIHIYTASY